MAVILVIDDEEAMAHMIRAILNGAGHEVVVAGDGDSGLEALSAGPVDLILTDILMPGRDGLETIRAARRLKPCVPILATTGGGRTGRLNFLEEAVEFGADATLRKPFGRSELLAAVNGLLAGPGVNR